MQTLPSVDRLPSVCRAVPCRPAQLVELLPGSRFVSSGRSLSHESASATSYTAHDEIITITLYKSVCIAVSFIYVQSEAKRCWRLCWSSILKAT